MLFRFRIPLLVAAVLAVGFGLVGCTDDDETPEEAVSPASSPEAAPPPQTDSTAQAAAAAAQQLQQIGAEAIYFSFDDYTLNADAQARLTHLGDALKGDTRAVVQIQGHCDERGSIEYNLALGDRRAQSVKTFLSQLGVDGARLTTISYGEERPAVEGHSEEAWAKNRRAQFVISNP